MREFLNILIIGSAQEQVQSTNEELDTHKCEIGITVIDESLRSERIFEKIVPNIAVIASRKSDDFSI